MAFWTKKKYLDGEQEAAVVAAIGRAEEGNRGEVRVHLERRCRHPGGPLARAEEMFYKLGMHQTVGATGVLLYAAMEAREAAVYAGPGIHTCCPKAFWQAITAGLIEGAATDTMTEKLVSAVDEIGDLLREHVPGEKDVGNELPDEVSFD